MPAKWARVWFGVTALCVVVGVTLSVVSAVHSQGHFPTGTERGFNTFSFFTVQSNLLVGATTLLLAIRLDRPSLLFGTFRLIALVAITVTGIVYHVALSGLLTLAGYHQLANQLVHTVVPVLTVVGWLLAGPRGQVTARAAWLSPIYPLAWLAFTLIRGAVIHWYPYPFVDVDRFGYGTVVVNCVWVSLLFLGIASGAAALDRRLRPRTPMTDGPADGPS